MIKLKESTSFSSLIEKIYPGKGCYNMTFQVTDDCNLACSYCYQINKGKRVMKLEDAKKFIDLFFSGDKGFDEYIYQGDKDKFKAIILEFIGGECTLYPKLIEDIIDYFREQAYINNSPFFDNFMISIGSNGTTYRNEDVQHLLFKYGDRISYNVTLDGNKELHDKCRRFKHTNKPSYDLAVDAIQDWKKHGFYMGSKITLCPENVSYVYEASKNMINLGFDQININCVFEDVWKPEHSSILYKQLKQVADYMLTLEKPQDIYYAYFNYDMYQPMGEGSEDLNHCGGDGKMISLDPDGKIFSCIRFMKSSLGNSQPELCIGDLENGIGKCASCQKCLDMFKGITRTSQSSEECLSCPVQRGCSWCSGYNYQVYGTLNKRTTYHCWMHKASSLANVYYINKLNKKFNDDFRLKINLPKEDALKIISEEEYKELEELTK